MKKHTTILLLLAVFVGLGLWGIFHGTPAREAMAAETPGTARELASASTGTPVVTVYKNPTCACCEGWADHLRESGFRVEMKEGEDLMKVKQRLGVAPDLASCHTAEAGGFAIEGHVPAELIRQLLADRPDVRGLTVPGMPAGVPGMPEAGPNRAPYQVLAIEHGGGSRVYATR